MAEIRKRNLGHHSMECMQWSLIGVYMCVSGDCDLLKEITAEVEGMLRVRGYEIPEQMSGEAQFYLDKLEINRIHLELNNDSLGNRLSKIIQMLESLDD